LARPIMGKMSPQEPIVASTTLPITRLNPDGRYAAL
jgi:hypothetical protein